MSVDKGARFRSLIIVLGKYMDLIKIKAILEDFSKENELELFDVSYQKSSLILSILFDNDLDLDALEDISSKLSNYLDKFEDEFDDNYFLDVSTVGVERPIRNEEELNKAVGSYIYVKTKENEYYGILHSFNNGVLALKVKDKNRNKDVSVEYNKIKQVRYAVEF